MGLPAQLCRCLALLSLCSLVLAQSPLPVPSDPACSTVQPPQNTYCPAMLSEDEVRRGFGAYYDSRCQVFGGSWAVYSDAYYTGGQSCCVTCRWNKADALAAWIQPSELLDCPPCVKAFYEAQYGGPVPIVPLSDYVSAGRCPFPVPAGGNMSLPAWLYNSETDKCYYKSSIAKGISGNINDATTRCQERHGAQLLKISSAAEDDFVRLNLLWTGFFGESYTGLKKAARASADFNNTWMWADGTPLLAGDYQRWGDVNRGFDFSDLNEEVCMEYLPQQPKTWNPFSCLVNKHYICERPAVEPGTVILPPPGTASSPAPAAPGPMPACSGAPDAPAGTVSSVLLVNAGGPAICGYTADVGAGAVAVGGAAENWVDAGNPACAVCATSPNTNCTACTVRFGGAFSYVVPTTAGHAYTLRLTFAEVYWTAAGRRMLDVLVNGAPVLTGIDPYALAGSRFVPVVCDVTVAATGATITISMQARIDNAVLSALEVYDMGEAPAVPTTPSPAPATPATASPAPASGPASPAPAAIASPAPAQSPLPVPSDPACSTVQPPQNTYCPAMLSEDEVRRGFGAYYDSRCQVFGGSWAVYSDAYYTGGQSCCVTCRWNKEDALAAWLQPSELLDCPPCVKAFYEAQYGGPVPIVPLSDYVSAERCPFPVPAGGNMSLPAWLYNSETDKCCYKSSIGKGISGNINDAMTRCQVRHGAQLLKISSAAEDDFVRLNLLWTGFFGESYTGLKKAARSSADFNNTWMWADGTPLLAGDYQRWGDVNRGFDFSDLNEEVCMEYLPQQPKAWNPFSCLVNKHYICERPAVEPSTVILPPLGTTSSPAPAAPAAPASPSPAPTTVPATCSMPDTPAGAVSSVVLVNAGGPAICGYTADNAASPAAVGGVAENWVGPDNLACAACAASPASCTACTVRFGGSFSYVVPTTSGHTYILRLTFTEVYWTEAGRRSMDVTVNGAPVLIGIDPYALAGARFVPVVREVSVTAAGAFIAVGLQARIDNALLSALEVYDMGAGPAGSIYVPSPAPAAPASPAPATSTPGPTSCAAPAPPAGAGLSVVLVNAGGPAICGYAADNAASPDAIGGVAENWVGPDNPACAACAASPTASCTACTVRFGGSFSYVVPTTSGHTYTLRLTFTEVYWTEAGRRSMDVTVNGAAVLTGIDPYALGGARFVPVVREVTVTATGAAMIVGLQARQDNAILAAFEVYDMTP